MTWTKGVVFCFLFSIVKIAQKELNKLEIIIDLMYHICEYYMYQIQIKDTLDFIMYGLHRGE